MIVLNLFIYVIVGMVIGALFSQVLKVPGEKLGLKGNVGLGLLGALVAGIPYELLFEERSLQMGIFYTILVVLLLLLGGRLVSKLTRL